MEHSYNQSFSRFSTSDYTNQNISLPRTMNSLSSLDLELQREQENRNKGIYNPSAVLLFKGIPDDVKEIEMLSMCQPFGILKDILIARHKRYAFVQFETIGQAANCYNAFMKFPPNLRGYNLYVFYTGKEKINKPDTLIGPPSRFLLFVFGKETRNIDQNMIFNLVKPFGKCLQVVLFQTKTLQAFVEMEDVIQALMAKEALDGKILMDSTHLTVFYSEEKDFFDEKETGFSSLLSFGNQPPPLRNMPYSMPEIPFQPKESPMMGPYGPPIHSYPNIDPNPTRLTKLASSDQLNKTMNLLSPLLHVKEEKANNILMVKNLPKNISARMLFLLFGMYGNVMKVKIFYKNPENALVEYQDEYQANLAKAYLNNCPLYGNNIFITNSKQGIVIDTSGLKKGEETQFMGDYSSSTEHRYKFAGSKNTFNIAPPSKVLHLSNLCDDKDEDFYRELFKSHAIVKKFIFLKSNDKMALMETEKISEAVDILINFHNYNIDGKFLKVSFSKYPKIKEFK